MIANLVFVLLVEAVVTLVTLALFQVTLPPEWPLQLMVTLLGTVGFVALGTFYAAMASRSRAREVMLPLLLFPMMVPVLLAAVQATAALMVGDPMREVGTWLRLLAIFDLVFLIATWMGYEYVIEL